MSLITSCYGGKYEWRWDHRPVKTFRGKRGRITLWGHKKLPRPRRSLAKYEVFFWSQRSPHWCVGNCRVHEPPSTSPLPTFNSQVFQLLVFKADAFSTSTCRIPWMFDLRFALKEFQFSTAMLVGLWSATKIKETCWERGVKTLDTTTAWTVVSYTQLVYFGCIHFRSGIGDAWKRNGQETLRSQTILVRSGIIINYMEWLRIHIMHPVFLGTQHTYRLYADCQV